jgi:hypothetical protein
MPLRQLLVLVISLALPLLATDSPEKAPAGFSFAGSWTCNGNFVRSGKIHRSTYDGRVLPGDHWIELTEQDIEPRGYVGHYLIGYDPTQKQMVELDANNAGYALYTSPGWADGTLTLTSTDTVSYKVPKNRFVFHVIGPDAFDVTWEMQNSSAWAASDHLSCHRTK